MRPTPIPDAAVWPGGSRQVIGPPDDDPAGQVHAVEAVIDSVDLYGRAVPRFSMRIRLDPGDLEALAENPTLWVSFIGEALHPFDVALAPAGVDHPSVRA